MNCAKHFSILHQLTVLEINLKSITTPEAIFITWYWGSLHSFQRPKQI